MQQWQYPQQHQPQQQQHQQQPHSGGFGQPQQQQPQGYGQPQPQAPAGFNMFGFGQAQQPQAGNFINPAMAATAMGMMSSLAAGQMPRTDEWSDQAGARFNLVMRALRSYFAVDNRYVVQKMKRIVFPFLHKHWRRNVSVVGYSGSSSSSSSSIKIPFTSPHTTPFISHAQLKGGDAGTVTYDLPIADDNAPDLYIPLMSVITYVLLCAFLYGNAGQFNPEVLPDVCSKCLLAQFVEVALIRVGFFLMQTDVPFLDLWAYTGYKYLGLSINMVVAMLGRLISLGGTTSYYASFLWTASAATFLMLKIMSHTVPMQTAHGGPKREVMVLAFAAIQPLVMWFVSQTKFL